MSFLWLSKYAQISIITLQLTSILTGLDFCPNFPFCFWTMQELFWGKIVLRKKKYPWKLERFHCSRIFFFFFFLSKSLALPGEIKYMKESLCIFWPQVEARSIFPTYHPFLTSPSYLHSSACMNTFLCRPSSCSRVILVPYTLGMEVSTYGCMKVKMKVAQSCPTLCNPWIIQSMEFSRPEYWSG